jgi:ABC-2 type transport system permease protein
LIDAVSLIIYGLLNVKVVWSPYKILIFMLMLFGVIVLFASLLVLKAAFCFWTIDGMELMNILQEGGKELSSYPISIYKDWFAKFFTYVVPFGMVNYFPLVYLLDKQEAPFWYGLTPLATIPFMLLMLGVWKIGLRNYKSAGS